MKRRILFDIATALRGVDTKDSCLLADKIDVIAENAELWEVEAIYEAFRK